MNNQYGMQRLLFAVKFQQEFVVREKSLQLLANEQDHELRSSLMMDLLVSVLWGP